MHWSMVAGVGLLSAVAAAGPVCAAEMPVPEEAPASAVATQMPAPAMAPPNTAPTPAPTEPALAAAADPERPRAARLRTSARRVPAQAVRPVARPARTVAQQTSQPTPNWSGTQVGGFNGATQMSNAMVEPGAFLFFAPILGDFPLATRGVNREMPFSVSGRPWSYTAGAFLGYNVQLGAYVIGVEGDVAWKNSQSTQSAFALTPATYFPTPFGTTGMAVRTESFNGSVKQTWDSSLRARAGFLYTPWTLIYATGGLALGDVSGSFGYASMITYPAGFGTVATSGGASWSDTRAGWTAGGGVETEVAPGVKVRAEYRYSDLGSYSKSIPLTYVAACAGCAAPSAISSGAQVNLHPTFQTIRVGLGFNF